MSDNRKGESAKEKLRREMRARLRGMGPAFHAEASLVICQAAANQPAFLKSRSVALFAPLPSEPDIHPLIEEAWAQGKRVVLPLMIKRGGAPELDWHEIASWDDVVVPGQPGPPGLREPDPLRCRRVPISELDCVFVPGVAFDDEGFRLGRGGGFYDNFLSLAPPALPCIGLMFSLQQVPLVPREAHDQALRSVITEDELITF
ncbi:MAG TPA: 5-formyltetrahydrofolate cyclo-ligase [Candidatus Methylacidiphilales bacterium]|jgi:5-formyltetrahydrofolate cyclo-ligase|nr:5-formyltetrahydrofolate cyclo-ligase [Candidatus Methylacidiphilales bacterium]